MREAIFLLKFPAFLSMLALNSDPQFLFVMNGT